MLMNAFQEKAKVWRLRAEKMTGLAVPHWCQIIGVRCPKSAISP